MSKSIATEYLMHYKHCPSQNATLYLSFLPSVLGLTKSHEKNTDTWRLLTSAPHAFFHILFLYFLRTASNNQQNDTIAYVLSNHLKNSRHDKALLAWGERGQRKKVRTNGRLKFGNGAPDPLLLNRFRPWQYSRSPGEIRAIDKSGPPNLIYDWSNSLFYSD